MTTIVITDKRAILVKSDYVALAEWSTWKVKDPDTGEKIDKSGWTEYKWPGTVERCIEALTRELVSDLNLTLTMKEFKEKWNEMLELIYKRIHEGKEAAV